MFSLLQQTAPAAVETTTTTAQAAAPPGATTSTVTVPLETVPVPPPSIFPSVFPTAGLPIIR